MSVFVSAKDVSRLSSRRFTIRPIINQRSIVKPPVEIAGYHDALWNYSSAFVDGKNNNKVAPTKISVGNREQQ